MSHELRTPLPTSIKGVRPRALLDGGKDDPSTAAAFLEIIMRQSNRLNLILDDLLQLSQIESRPILFRRGAGGIADLTGTDGCGIKPLADKKTSYDRIVARTIMSWWKGRERLVRVFINLLENAVKYTPDQGRISMAIRQATQNRTASPRR